MMFSVHQRAVEKPPGGTRGFCWGCAAGADAGFGGSGVAFTEVSPPEGVPVPFGVPFLEGVLLSSPKMLDRI